MITAIERLDATGVVGKYTLETLKEINPSYDAEHRVNAGDVDNVNKMVKLIEGLRKEDTPVLGDIVEYTDRYGTYSPRAHIDRITEEGAEICEHAGEPFVFVDDSGENVYHSTSGGAWTTIPTYLEKVGQREKSFVIWGHCGATGNGAVRFFVTVNVWRYMDGNPEFTTKDYDRLHVYVVDPTKEPNEGYRYIISGYGGSAHRAFRTEPEYRKWLESHYGVEVGTENPRSFTVWTYKQNTEYVGQESFDKIAQPEDKVMFNGRMTPCKRLVEGTMVTTFILRHDYIYKHH